MKSRISLRKKFAAIAFASTALLSGGSLKASAYGNAEAPPWNCTAGYLCIYDFTNFGYHLKSFYYSNTSWAAYNAYKNDDSAYNNGSPGQWVTVRVNNGWYCLINGRGWRNLPGMGLGNQGRSNRWGNQACLQPA
jgi:hypothetical protein